MNQYELIDTINSYSDVISTSYKYWTTTSFAVVAAAYVAGPQLGSVLTIGIAFIYLFLAFGNVGMVRLYTNAVRACTRDLAALGENTELLTTSEVISAPGKFFMDFAGPMVTIMMLLGSLGTVAYLFHQAGFFG